MQLAGELDLHGGFLFLITSTAAGAASLIRRLLEADDVNQTPMERNRDLKEEEEEELLLLPLPLLMVPRSESAGLHAQRRPDDEGDMAAPRWSRPAMRSGRRGLVELPADWLGCCYIVRARPCPRPAS